MQAPSEPSAAPVVRHLRQALLWPLRLMPPPGAAVGARRRRPWAALLDPNVAGPWREVVDEYTGDPGGFHERHYNEFVTFLPYVQRFLYGEGRSTHDSAADGGGRDSPMRVFRRRDVARVRLVSPLYPDELVLDVHHVDLYFFYDVDVVLLNVEVAAADLPLPQALDLMYRFGRGYPPGWDAEGLAQHCMQVSEWLDGKGQVLARSDASDREAFLAYVCRHRAARVSAHWAWLLEPLVPHHSDRPGLLRYRPIEFHRMPLAAYVAVDDPRALTRADFIRLGLVTGAAPPGEAQLPFAEDTLADFEQRYCYDRFFTPAGGAPYTRYLCTGQSMVVVGDAHSAFYRCDQRGVLAQFRHQHFLLFLIAHFQKAALLIFSDRLVEALKALDVADAVSVRRFKRSIRASFEGFLRFTHRYGFHDVSEQAQARALFQRCTQHLGLEPLTREVKERIADMNSYLEGDSLRRQANTVLRLTVVTIFGLIGTVTTGFLGMNLLAEADAPWPRRLAMFGLVFGLTSVLTIYTIAKSKRLSDLLDAWSDERLGWRDKLRAVGGVWRQADAEDPAGS